MPASMTMLGDGVFAVGPGPTASSPGSAASTACTSRPEGFRLLEEREAVIPPDHPRYRSLVVRERLARCAREGVVALEGLTAHGRAEAFDYLIGERSTETARLAARTAAALFRQARSPVLSVNGNTAALAARECAALQQATGCGVEVNLFHRTPERMAKITALLERHGVSVLGGDAERLLPLAHDRALCLPHGIGGADLVLVPLEDGDRCEALRGRGEDRGHDRPQPALAHGPDRDPDGRGRTDAGPAPDHRRRTPSWGTARRTNSSGGSTIIISCRPQ